LIKKYDIELYRSQLESRYPEGFTVTFYYNSKRTPSETVHVVARDLDIPGDDPIDEALSIALKERTHKRLKPVMVEIIDPSIGEVLKKIGGTIKKVGVKVKEKTVTGAKKAKQWAEEHQVGEKLKRGAIVAGEKVKKLPEYGEKVVGGLEKTAYVVGKLESTPVRVKHRIVTAYEKGKWEGLETMFPKKAPQLIGDNVSESKGLPVFSTEQDLPCFFCEPKKKK